MDQLHITSTYQSYILITMYIYTYLLVNSPETEEDKDVHLIYSRCHSASGDI